MSCETLNRLAVQLSVSIASLPEGFCPSSMQDLANAIGERILISPNSDFNTFAIGSVEPTSNVGPWFKDCLKWYVYDDETAGYVPIAKGGFDSVQVFDSSGSFIVPDEIFKIKVEGWGAGGGGADESGGSSSPGGGGGGYGMIIKTVTPGQAITLTVGTGGAGGTPGIDGGDTSVLGMTCGGGQGGVQPEPGEGGAVTGADLSVNGGGAAKAGGGGGGVGGNSPNGGSGGNPDTLGGTNVDGVTPGGGGCGGTVSNAVAGNGGNGRIVIWY